eukprot:scaffold1610_cov257-Pinguiococcus_pyrenoidosus.AAC.40
MNRRRLPVAIAHPGHHGTQLGAPAPGPLAAPARNASRRSRVLRGHPGSIPSRHGRRAAGAAGGSAVHPGRHGEDEQRGLCTGHAGAAGRLGAGPAGHPGQRVLLPCGGGHAAAGPDSVRHSRPDFRLGGPERLVTDFGSFARGTPLRWAAAELQCDRELLLAAAAFSYDALEFCCEHLQSDAEFVLAAIAAHPRGGWALQYVAVALRSDARVVEAAVLSCPDVFQFAAEDLRVDRNLIRLVCEGFAKYESEDDQNVVREYIHEAYRSQVERWAASESAVARRDSLRLTFPELHARFISCPVEGDDERLADMPDLGWYVRSSLATEDS